jgi:hypothetical protein
VVTTISLPPPKTGSCILAMALVQQLMQFAQNSNNQQRYDLLASVFVLPGEAGFDQFALEVQRLSVSLQFLFILI